MENYQVKIDGKSSPKVENEVIHLMTQIFFTKKFANYFNRVHHIKAEQT